MDDGQAQPASTCPVLYTAVINCCRRFCCFYLFIPLVYCTDAMHWRISSLLRCFRRRGSGMGRAEATNRAIAVMENSNMQTKQATPQIWQQKTSCVPSAWSTSSSLGNTPAPTQAGGRTKKQEATRDIPAPQRHVRPVQIRCFTHCILSKHGLDIY